MKTYYSLSVPQKTWVFVVGCLEWEDSETYSPFDKQGRKDAEIVNYFRDVAKIPSQQIIYIKDKDATVDYVKQQFRQFLAKTKSDDFLFFYYCGHGYKNEETEQVCFACYDASDETEEWEVQKDIVMEIENKFHGSYIMLCADCCNSGGLSVAVEQLVRQKMKDLNQAQQLPDKLYSCFVSVNSEKTSTANWTFSSALMDCLRGKCFVKAQDEGTTCANPNYNTYRHMFLKYNPQFQCSVDENKNQGTVITLSDVQKYIFVNMAHVEKQYTHCFVPFPFSVFVVSYSSDVKKHKRVGDIVLIDYEGEDWMARIEDYDPSSKTFLIRYFDYVNSDTEWVTEDELKPFKPQVLPVGTKILVQSEEDEQWYPARVLQTAFGLHYIAYDDYDECYNEWVDIERIKLPGKEKCIIN